MITSDIGAMKQHICYTLDILECNTSGAGGARNSFLSDSAWELNNDRLRTLDRKGQKTLHWLTDEAMLEW